MRPVWRIEIGGEVPHWSSEIDRLRVVEVLGVESDELELELPDPGAQYAAPRRGVRIAVALGFTRPISVGTFTVVSAGATGPPPRILVRGEAVDLVDEALKAPRTRAWGDELTIGSVVTTIASAHDLEAHVDPSLEDVQVGHVDQVGESDASRLTRLARKYDGVYKHGGGRLLVVPRALARSVATGRQLALARLLPDVVLQWAVRYLDRPVVAAVRASYQDLAAGMPGSVEVGSGRPRKRLPQLYHDRATAAAAAKAHLAAAARAAARLTASVAGDPTLTAAQPLEISGLHPTVEGRWLIEQVAHTVDRDGFRTQLQATPEPPAVEE